ncbi:hypothetical protein TPA2_gp06 [Tsukamurella phage TPA2]|uniref:hypothetical protein n=1 Tax=Tsukamurella phage TPA2 TaxID=981330 RepID=UPI0001FF8D9D|nr:hypothetical protein TPA2_gp06 [Tsukamurella phage TPA2]ADX31920.1 hypothetical protein [Tsukamurella phage TPA2]
MTVALLIGLAVCLFGAWRLRAAETRRAEEVAAFIMLSPLAVFCAYVFVSGGN